MADPKIIIILGRAGSGKGTQAELLEKKLGLDYVGSGEILRERNKVDDFTGRKLKEVMGKGELVPTSVLFNLWVAEWEKLKNVKEFKGFIIDGSPRKLMEAKLMYDVLTWYEWEKYLHVLLLDISRGESVSRLLKRGREDDTTGAINTRLDLFDEEVMPVVEYYGDKVTKINGEQSIEDVHKEIMEVLKNDKD